MNSVIVVVVVWILFVVEIDMNDFNISCWIGKNFRVDVGVRKFNFLEKCPFDRKVVEISKESVVRGFSVVDGFG